MMELRSVSKTYPLGGGGAVRALDDVSVRFPDGETTVLLGPSGGGKSTLLRTLNRMVEPDSGEVLIDGESARLIDAVELRRRTGYVIQNVGLFPHLSVAENVAVVPRLLRWDRARIAARTAEVLDLVRLPRAYGRRRPHELSGGEAQRVGVARALAADPRTLLMDEPFGALDASTREALQDEFLRIQGELRKTVVFVTHDVAEAARLADRIVVLRAGRVAGTAETSGAGAFLGPNAALELLGRTAAAARADFRPAAAERAASLPGAPIEGAASLREALSRLVAEGRTELAVRDGGRLGLLDFRGIARGPDGEDGGR